MSRRVFVSGSVRGIGLAVAEELQKKGYTLTLHGRAPSEHSNQVLKEFQEHDPETRVLYFDIGERSNCLAVLQEEVETKGAFYGVVCSAGCTRDMPFAGMSGDDWDYVVRANLDSFFNILNPLIMPMIKLRSGGRIVVLSSISGITGNRGQVHYSAAKAGLIGASKALARELASRSITVNCVAPGAVESEMISDELKEGFVKSIPMGRLGRVEEVARSVSFLFEEEAGYMTGQTLVLSGGLV